LCFFRRLSGSGRWKEQQSRLLVAGYQHVFFVVEGDLREADVGLPYLSMLSACLNAELRKSHLIRSMGVQETAAIVGLLVTKGCGLPPGIPSGLAPPRPLTKRKKDAGKKTILIRQLMIIPSCSENVAKKLAEHFGSLSALQKGLTQKTFPKIQLDARQTIGKSRVKKLGEYLL
jgi:ERCC4-type nuclease